MTGRFDTAIPADFRPEPFVFPKGLFLSNSLEIKTKLDLACGGDSRQVWERYKKTEEQSFFPVLFTTYFPSYLAVTKLKTLGWLRPDLVLIIINEAYGTIDADLVGGIWLEDFNYTRNQFLTGDLSNGGTNKKTT